MSNTIWKPSFCFCKIEYDHNFTFVKSHKKCKKHELIIGQAHVDILLSETKFFNSESFGLEIPRRYKKFENYHDAIDEATVSNDTNGLSILNAFQNDVDKCVNERIRIKNLSK